MLGYFEESSVRSYEQIAHANGFTYVDAGSEGWKAMAKVDGELAPKVNKEFLVQQIKEGKDFVLTSNPSKAFDAWHFEHKGESFYKEMIFLQNNGYKFEKYGNFWRVYK